MTVSNARCLLAVEGDFVKIDADLSDLIHRVKMAGLDGREGYAAGVRKARALLRRVLFEMSDEITTAVNAMGDYVSDVPF